MSVLVFEMRAPHGWHHICSLTAGDRPGTVSHNTPEGRQVVMFTNHGAHAVIERSVAGFDMEHGELRTVTSLGFERLARLVAGDTFELWLRTDGMPGPTLCRFRVLA